MPPRPSLLLLSDVAWGSRIAPDDFILATAKVAYMGTAAATLSEILVLELKDTRDFA